MDKEMLVFRKDREFYNIQVSDIVCIERRKSVVWVRMSDGTFLELSNTSLVKILQNTSSDKLQRCGRSAIINRDYIYAVDPGNQFVILRNGLGTLELGVYFKNGILQSLADKDDEFLLRIDNIRYVIREEDFLYAKNTKRVLHVYMRDGYEFLVTQKPIDFILRQINSKRIIRCARGVLVNCNHIRNVDTEKRQLQLINGVELTIGSSFLEEFGTKTES